MDSRRIEALMDLLEGAGDPDSVPTSAVRDLRGRRSQEEIALKAGLGQAYLSQIESGRRSLTKDVALKMAPALDVSADELLMAEEVSALQRQAVTGELDPRRVLDLILELAEQDEDDELAQDALDALLTVAKKSLATYQSGLRERREEQDVESAEVSTKSRKPEPTRDSLGRRLDKPHQPPRGA